MFTDYEKNLLNTKPKFLNDDEKKLRTKCRRKIEYQKIKDSLKKERISRRLLFKKNIL
jgi:hypothetical protein